MTKIIMRSAAFAAVLFSLSVPAMAQNATFNPKQRIDSFSEANIAHILKKQNMTVSKRWTSSSGNKMVALKMKNGIIANLSFGACNKTTKRCLGLSIISSWTMSSKWNQAEKLAFANIINNRYSFIKAGVAEDGKMYILRYTIADFDTYAGNIQAELANFESISTKFREKMLAKNKELQAK